MRTLSAILLSILMGLPIAAPLFASGEPSLPACCRRDGKHHCMRSVSPGTTGESAVGVSRAEAKCPQFPRTLGLTSRGQPGLTASAAVFAEIVSHPAVSPQAQSNYRVSLVRAHQKRGPPSVVLC